MTADVVVNQFTVILDSSHRNEKRIDFAVVTKDVPSHSVVKGLNQIRPKRPEEIPDKYKLNVEN